MIRRLVSRMASNPRLFDGLRWVLEAGYRGYGAVIRREGIARHDKVLDCGCGTGVLARFFEPERYVGIDINPIYRASARKKNPRHRFEVMGAARMDFPDSVFSACMVSGVLHHLPDATCGEVLSEIRRVLRNDGRLFVWEDVPTRNRLNVIGSLAHSLDEGEFIRKPEDYRWMLEKEFAVLWMYPMRSGFMDYVVFVCGKRGAPAGEASPR